MTDADHHDARFLTLEQEAHLFRKMNFLKCQAAELQNSTVPNQAPAKDLERAQELLKQADMIRSRIIRSNFGLVIALVKKYGRGRQDFFDLISEGTVALIHASDRFDVSRGARFSTYATCAILNNLFRRIREDRSSHARFATGRERLLTSLADYRANDRADTMEQEQFRYTIGTMLEYLDGRERSIIVRRFGLAGDKATLVQIGRELGLTKERVRQLESKAMGKLRRLARRAEMSPG